MEVRLVKVTALVENVLKGNVSERNITFYYYYPEYGFSLPSLNLIAPHDRAIFFLQRDRGAYRSVNDVYASCIHILTGSHPGLSSGGKTVEEAITEACILPGSARDLDRGKWPLWIGRGANIGAELIGKQATVALLNSMRDHADYRVRAEVCLAIANLLPIQHSCVNELKLAVGFDNDFDFQMRRQVRLLLVRYHYQFGAPLPSNQLEETPPPGVPPAQVNMQLLKVWWPW